MDRTSLDKMTDLLADAALSPEERRVWDSARVELIAARAQLEKMEIKLKALERHDEETEIHTVLTKPEFNREVARMLALNARYGGQSSVLYFDLENLNDIMTEHGRSISNAVVRVVCDTMLKQCRASDLLGRLAVDEFGVLLASCDNAMAWKKGEKLAAAIHKALTEVHGLPLKPILNYGAYTFRENEDIATGLKQAALSVTR